MKEYTYTTFGGAVIRLRPISAVKRDLWQASDKPPKKPVYRITTEPGDVLEFEHDETTLETPLDRALWRQWLQDLERHKAARAEDTVRFYIKHGTYLLQDTVVPAEWGADLVELGKELPVEPEKLKMLYILSEVLCIDHDINGVMTAIAELSQRGTVDIVNAEALFRPALERAAAEQSTAAAGQLES